MADTIRIRRVAPRRWGWRKRYDVELLTADGQVAAASRNTVVPSAFLVKRAGVHSTDSWDWVHSAHAAFERGSTEWVTWPYGDWRPPCPASTPRYGAMTSRCRHSLIWGALPGLRQPLRPGRDPQIEADIRRALGLEVPHFDLVLGGVRAPGGDICVGRQATQISSSGSAANAGLRSDEVSGLC